MTYFHYSVFYTEIIYSLCNYTCSLYMNLYYIYIYMNFQYVKLYSVYNLFLTNISPSKLLFWDVNFSFMHQILHSDWTNCSQKALTNMRGPRFSSHTSKKNKSQNKLSPFQLSHILIHYLLYLFCLLLRTKCFVIFHFALLIHFLPSVVVLVCFSQIYSMVWGAYNSQSFKFPWWICPNVTMKLFSLFSDKHWALLINILC